MLLIVRPCPRPPRFHPLLLARRPRCGHGSHVGGGGSGQGGAAGEVVVGLNIGLFQFSSQISVTLVSVLFTHDWSTLYTNNFLVRECFYLLVS